MKKNQIVPIRLNIQNVTFFLLFCVFILFGLVNLSQGHKIHQLNSQILTIKSNTDDLEDRVSELESKIDDLENDKSELEEKVTSLEDRVDNLENRTYYIRAY
jgi:peptidoglycan hydrolase CwlO-like protein